MTISSGFVFSPAYCDTRQSLCECCLQSQTDYAALIDEWAVRFFQEMDYEQEARNAIQFREDMASLEGIVVPEFYPDLCTRKVLVSQWIEGKKKLQCNAWIIIHIREQTNHDQCAMPPSYKWLRDQRMVRRLY